jgi:hypothetical protein
VKKVNAVLLPKRRHVRRSAQQWSALIEAQSRSGMSVWSFAIGQSRTFT